MKKMKQKYLVAIFIILSLFIMGVTSAQAQTNIPPTVDAGIDITIGVIDVATTTLYGFVTDPDNTGFLKCAWEHNLQQLTMLMDPVGINGMCAVDLSALNNPGAGMYTLILYGLDGSVIASDSMLLTIVDGSSGPIANAGADITITTDQIATTILQGSIVNINSTSTEPLNCAWYENSVYQLTPIFAVGPNGECPLDLTNAFIDFDIGSYTLVLYGLEGSVIYSDTMILTIIPPNTPATVNAGGPVEITTDQIATTTIYGSVTDPDNTGFLKCAWEDAGTLQQVTPLMDVVNNVCPLDLSTAINISFEVGQYTLILYALDGSFISSDSMLLTIIPANIAPVADAGLNISIITEQIAATVIHGTATDADGDPLSCRWTDGLNELLPTSTVINGICDLDLSTITIGLGTYNLYLEVSDGQTTNTDEMILTIDNSAPHAAPGGGGVYEINSVVVLVGDVSDFDGDLLSYQWIEGATNVICSGNIQAPAEGTPIIVPDCLTSSLSLGIHTISLQADDGLNLPDSNSVDVEIVDTTVPTLAPLSSDYLLWPPNHIMVDVVIEANAVDNSGLPVTLNALVSSNEPDEGQGDGDMPNDILQPSINQTTGVISLQLRRERSGSGNGRIYSVTITATDSSGNTSSTVVDIKVPHDKKKK